jgi:hypothetical protein
VQKEGSKLVVSAKGRVKAGGQCKRKGQSWRLVQNKGLGGFLEPGI